MPENWQSGGFALYVHWPFCEAKCPYCDFNSHVVAHVDQARWARALASEIRRLASETPGRVLSSIFFGGGTPSLMAPQTVETVLRAASDGWTWANDIEISLEANPRSVEAARFAGYAAAGVNRVSLGVQALNDADLQRLGRLHDATEARAAFETARTVFDRVSFDLIYARQDQSIATWEAELREAQAMAVDHLSLYQLTLEPDTAFWDRRARGGLRGLPDEDRAADLYEMTNALCADAGYVAYEVSNHARPGAESRHNLVYWRYGDWAGVGPGAHGRLTLDGARYATEAPSAPGAWLTAVEAEGMAEARSALAPRETEFEHIMMGLRLEEGLDIERLPLLKAEPAFLASVDSLVDDGLLWKAGPRVGTSTRGRMLLNAVVSALQPD